MEKMDSTIKATVILIVLSMIGYLLKLGFNICLARRLPASLYGDFSVAIQVLNIVSTFILFGTNVSASRFLARYLVLADNHTIQDYLSWNLRVILASSFICFMILIFSVGLLVFLHLSSVLRLEELHIAVHMLWLAPILAMILLLASFLLSNHNYYLSYFFTHFAKYICMFLFIFGGSYFFNTVLDKHNLVAMVLFAFVIVLIIEIVVFRLYMPPQVLVGLISAWQKPKSLTHEWTLTSMRLIGNGLMFIIVTAASLLMVEIIVPNKDIVAYYAATLVVANILFVTSNSIYNHLKPQFSTALVEKGFAMLQKKLDQTNLIAYGVLVIAVVLINVLASKIFAFFGDQFVPAARMALLILSVGYFIGAACKPAALILAYSGNEKALLKTTVAELFTLLLFGVILTYFYNIEGAALAVTISISLKSFLACYAVRRLYPIRSCLIV